MKITLPKFLSPFYERGISGDSVYSWSDESWGNSNCNLAIAQNHPILTPALLFVSKLFSQARFEVRDKTTKKSVDHWLLDLLADPNYYQTQNDFLESLMFMQIAQGKAVIYMKRGLMGNPNAFYLLNSDLIKFPDGFKTNKFGRGYDKEFSNVKIKYDESGENLDIKLSDLLWFYDLPNALQKNSFKNASRLDGLNQTLINTDDSLLAKNIILKTNGKELITMANKESFPLSNTEKQQAENLFNSNYGLGANKKRGLITKANLNWKSLHIALRDLGLDESVKVDGNLIYTALHIPKDILSLEAKKTTYNNFKESMVSYIQNEMQSSLDAFTSVLNGLIEENNLEIVGSYEHLPIMQFILIERYKGVEQLGKALLSLRVAGLPDDVCLEKVGLDKNIELNELKQESDDESSETNESGNEAQGNDEENGE